MLYVSSGITVNVHYCYAVVYVDVEWECICHHVDRKKTWIVVRMRHITSSWR